MTTLNEEDAATRRPAPLAAQRRKPQGIGGFLSSRGTVFAYNLLVLFVLTGLLIAYFKVPLRDRLPTELIGLPAYAVWFGALGGLTTSFRGVYDHSADWTSEWAIWHYGRPFGGAVVGGVTLVLLLAANKDKSIDELSAPLVLTAAFVLATQEKRFMNFAYEVAKLALQVPSETEAVAPSISGISPDKGAAGVELTIRGGNFGSGTAVQLGDVELTDMIVSVKGNQIRGKVPERKDPGKAPGKVDVVVANPGITPVYLPDGFEYTA